MASSSAIKTRKQVIRIEMSKKQLLRSYIGLVTENNIPFNILNCANMQNIINPICDGFNSKYHKKITLNSSNCKKVLRVVSENIRRGLKKELAQRLLSLKIDSATRL